MTTEERYRDALERIANGYVLTTMPRGSFVPKDSPQLPSEQRYISTAEIEKFRHIARSALSPTEGTQDA